jgi:hypothetical protein
MDLDVRVVPLALGQLADPVDESERLSEVPERVFTLQGTFNLRVTVG